MIKNTIVFTFLCAGSLGAMDRSNAIVSSCTSGIGAHKCYCREIAADLPRSSEGYEALERLKRKGCIAHHISRNAKSDDADDTLGDFGIDTHEESEKLTAAWGSWVIVRELPQGK
jgi:hypothetical protein